MKSCSPCQKVLLILVILTQNSYQSFGSKYTKYRNDSTADQLVSFATKIGGPLGILTTSSGYPVSLMDTQTINTRLLMNDFFMESMTQLVNERIPERIVHAKGTGAHGYFKVTHDLSDICKAKLFSTVGKKTQVVARFSSVVQRHGGLDTSRENRGFSVKFYTEEGNFDFVGITAEMFLMKDPIFFSTFVHTFHKNPTTMVLDDTARWDFLTQRPETLNMFMRLFGDRGIPDGYRHMPAFTIHTFELLNDIGHRTFARFHMIPDLGIRNLTTAQANRIRDLDYATRDLYNAIADGNFPTWTLNVQTISEHEVSEAKFDIFDVTKLWPVRLYPLQPIGTLKLNRNPENQFAEIEQLAFSPGNLVPGIRGIDSVFESRVLSYRDAHINRLGVNFNKIHINCPLGSFTKTYNRDGPPPVKDNERDSPNYFPNSFHGPVPYLDNTPPRINVYTDPKIDNFDQAAELYIEMSEGERCRLVENIVASLSVAEPFLQERAVKYYKLIHTELGSRIDYGLKIRTSSMYSQCDRENTEYNLK